MARVATRSSHPPQLLLPRSRTRPALPAFLLPRVQQSAVVPDSPPIVLSYCCSSFISTHVSPSLV